VPGPANPAVAPGGALEAGAEHHDREQVREEFRRFARNRDATLRNELVKRHMGLAEYLARRFASKGEPLDDLVQVAALALIKAVDRFEPDRGLEFSTYATPTIVGELKRHFRDRSWVVRVPRRSQELHVRVSSVLGGLSQTYGRSPTISEIALAVGATEDEVVEAMEVGNAYRVASLDAPMRGEDSGTLGSRIGVEDQHLVNSEYRATLGPMIARFPEREQLILRLRFFEGRTQSEIAKELGISQMHVSRLLSRTLARLRAHVSA
jgi:RNA polymerase sigma-B factor